MQRALPILAMIACGKSTPTVVTVDRARVAVTVTASVPGASAEDMARSVATPLEHELGQIPSIVGLHSRSTDGATKLIAEFPPGTDSYQISEKVYAAVKQASTLLPSEAPEPPIVTRGSRSGAVMRLILRSKQLSLVEMTAVAKTVSDKLSELAGVDRVEACGTVGPARTLQVDPAALAARGKSVKELLDGVADWAGSPTRVDLEALGVGNIDTAPRPPACVAFDATERFVALTVMLRTGATMLAVRDQLERMVPKVEAMLPPKVALEVLPRTRPLAFEVRFPPGLARAAQLASVQQALPHTGQALAELGVTGALDPDPDAADIRIVAPAGDTAAIETALAGQALVVFAATDHVVGIAGVDPTALRTHAAALADVLGRTPGLHVVEQRGLATAPVTRFEIDRDAAARLGVTAYDVARATRLLVPGGTQVATLASVDRAPVFVTLTGEPTDALEILRLGGAPLATFVKLTRTTEPTAVLHEGQVRWVGLRVSGPLDALTHALAKVAIPAGIQRELREPD